MSGKCRTSCRDLILISMSVFPQNFEVPRQPGATILTSAFCQIISSLSDLEIMSATAPLLPNDPKHCCTSSSLHHVRGLAKSLRCMKDGPFSPQSPQGDACFCLLVWCACTSLSLPTIHGNQHYDLEVRGESTSISFSELE